MKIVRFGKLGAKNSNDCDMRSRLNSFAKITSIKGKSLVWNQLLRKTTLRTISGITYSDTSGDTFTVNGSLSPSDHCILPNTPLIAGHKYLCIMRVKNFPSSSSASMCFQIYDSSNVTTYGSLKNNEIDNEGALKIIFSALNNSSSTYCRIRLDASITYVDTVFSYPELFDLTLMFGVGNEPATVEKFEELFNAFYYSQNAKKIINNEATAIESRDENDGLLSTVQFNIPVLTGRLNGEGDSVVIAAEGLKSIGDVYDEGIVENGYLTQIELRVKTRAYQSGDENDATLLTDGMNTNYPLSTSEVYILDTPISVKYKVQNRGVQKRLPEDTASAVTAPFVGTIEYPTKIDESTLHYFGIINEQ